MFLTRYIAEFVQEKLYRQKGFNFFLLSYQAAPLSRNQKPVRTPLQKSENTPLLKSGSKSVCACAPHVPRGCTSWSRPPGVELRAHLKSISNSCHFFEVLFVWELTQETVHLPLGCLQGGSWKSDEPERLIALVQPGQQFHKSIIRLC